MNTPDAAAVNAELERILSSNVFNKSAVLSNFLRFVVCETIDNNVESIKEYSIAVKALGRPADFNPQIDSMIRIHAGRLRRSLMEYYNKEGIDDPVNIAMNRGSYVPQFSLRTKENDLYRVNDRNGAKNGVISNRLAILPFKNLSGDAANDFVIDGFCEQLSADLAQFPEIAIIAYYSSSKFKEEKSDIRAVGRELNASHIITGSIFRDKKRLRISMQLINAYTGAQLWTQTFEKAVHSNYLFDLFDDIIRQVAPKISGYYGIINRSSSFTTQLNPTSSADNIDAVFWYYHYQIRYTEDTFQTARKSIENALEHNPDHALGWGVLAQMYVDGEALCYKTVDNPLQEAHNCIEHALLLDRDCQHAHISLAWMYVFLRKKDDAIKSVKKCISINPKSTFFIACSCYLMGLLGEYDSSMEYFKETNVLNPYYPWWVNLGPYFMHYYHGDYESALDFANRINIPGVFWNYIFKISALGQLGRMEEARLAADKFQLQFPGKAKDACKVTQALIFHESVHERIKEGLCKAGLVV